MRAGVHTRLTWPRLGGVLAPGLGEHERTGRLMSLGRVSSQGSRGGAPLTSSKLIRAQPSLGTGNG